MTRLKPLVDKHIATAKNTSLPKEVREESRYTAQLLLELVVLRRKYEEES